MADLEKEFQKLIDNLYQQIADKKESGELDSWDAQALHDMVYNRVASVEGKEDDSWCASRGNDYDDGWSPSQVCW